LMIERAVNCRFISTQDHHMWRAVEVIDRGRVRVRKGVAARGLAGDDPFPCRRLRIVDGRGHKATGQTHDTTGGRDISKYFTLQWIVIEQPTERCPSTD